MNLIQAWKTIFRRITPKELAAHELAEAELKLLEARTGGDYAAAMISYHQTRVERLRKYLAEWK